MPPRGNRRSTEKPKDMRGTVRQLLPYLAPYKITFIIALLCAAGSVAIAVYEPKVMGEIITEIANGFMNKVQGGSGIDFDRIAQICLTLLGVYFFSNVLEYVQGWMMAGVSSRLGFTFRQQMAEKIDRLPLSYYDKVSHGDVISRFTNDVDTLIQSLNQSLSSIISNFVKIFGYLFMMITISWKMTLLALVVIPLSLIAVLSVVRRSQAYFQAQQNSLGALDGHIEEMYDSHVVVQAFNGEQRSLGTFDKLNDSLYSSAWRSQFLSGLMQPLTQFIGNLGYVGVCILGGTLCIRGEIAVGDIQSFITYTRNFTQPINQISQSINQLQAAAAAAERVFAFLNAPDMTPDTDHPLPLVSPKGSVVFENIRFGYNPDKPVIRNFSMFVRPGQSVAIVGPTGAGKTTIVKLLMRFYELDGGAIYLDEHPITEYTRSDLRRQVGMVLQDAWLFEGTIRENLRFGRPDATDAQVEEAAKMAHVDHFIRTLEHGYDTVLNEDSSNISQGQRQLLTIARAFLADPRILILDEATSSVDTRTETLIQQGMDDLMKGRTSFIIAHRLSTIRNADTILVMNEGDIVEVGSHDALMEKNGFYAQLYNAQFAGMEI